MGESTLSKGPITSRLKRACPDALRRHGPKRLVGSGITYPACCADPLQKGHGAADVRHPDQHANEMAAQSAQPDGRLLLRTP